jgi:hypothetical protein
MAESHAECASRRAKKTKEMIQETVGGVGIEDGLATSTVCYQDDRDNTGALAMANSGMHFVLEQAEDSTIPLGRDSQDVNAAVQSLELRPAHGDIDSSKTLSILKETRYEREQQQYIIPGSRISDASFTKTDGPDEQCVFDGRNQLSIPGPTFRLLQTRFEEHYKDATDIVVDALTPQDCITLVRSWPIVHKKPTTKQIKTCLKRLKRSRDTSAPLPPKAKSSRHPSVSIHTISLLVTVIDSHFGEWMWGVIAACDVYAKKRARTQNQATTCLIAYVIHMHIVTYIWP